MSKHRSVLVVGGGIGGLCLAHGLVQAGIDVQVAERTHARTDWVQGYRIHIGPHGSRALHACLPTASWARFCDTVAGGAGTFSFRTEQLAPLLVVEAEQADDPVEQHHGISRIALREVLLDGLADVVAFGRDFERYEILPDGRVRAHFADGTTTEADLLVGADGANSRVRGQLLPHARRLDTGVAAIAGKHPLTGDDDLPSALLAGATTVVPPGPGGMFTAVWRGDRARVAAVPAGAPPGFLFDTTTDYVFWAYADAAAAFPPLDGLAGPELTAVVADKIVGWSPGLRQLVAGSAPDTVNALRIRSAEPVAAWPTGPVTLLGDAIHNMTPMAGIGATTALRDADLLRRNLIAAGSEITAAVADYERRMLDYGFAAVARSLRNARFATSGHRIARGLLRGVNLVPPLKRRMLEADAVQLRRARVGDEWAVAEVHVRSWQVGYRGLVADDFLDALRPADRAERYAFDGDDPLTIVAVTDRIRGFATISPGAGMLRAFYVDPESWGTGLGRALIVEAERRLTEHHTVATLWVLTGNVRARRFYEASGWRTDGSERRDRVFGATVDEVGYRKTLVPAEA